MFYNNSLVDRAARLANQARPQVFWQQWESHVAAATAADGIFHQVSALQLAVAQRQVRHGQPHEVLEQAPEPKQTRQFEPCFALRGWNGQPLPKLARLFGGDHANRVAQWFLSRLTTGADAQVVWVSMAQSYLDFQLCWGNPGPVRVNNVWVDVATRPYIAAEVYPFRTRVRWFKQLVKAMVKEAGILTSFQQCRPHSTAIQTYVPSMSVPWSDHALREVDLWLLGRLGAPCTRAAGSLATLPIAAQSSRMAL
jgi:hypothetical protein